MESRTQKATSFCCIKCKNTFSNISNLRKHVKNLHVGEGSYLKSLQIRKRGKDTDKFCEYCDKRFSNAPNQKRHFRRYHVNDSGELNRTAVVERKKVKKQTDNLFLCDQCPRMFIHKSSLNLHLKSHHIPKRRLSIQSLWQHKCVLCNYVSTKKLLLIHYRKSHNTQIEKKQYTFPSIDDFFYWKAMYENETNSKYIKEFNTIREGYILKSFNCHRSGNYLSKSKGLRRLKLQGSVKINGFCPAGIRLKINSLGECDVHVVETHLGHQLEAKYLNSTKSKWLSLAKKNALKIPFDNIPDSVGDSNLKSIHSTQGSSIVQECQSHLTESNAISKTNTTESLDITKMILEDDITGLIELIKVEGPDELVVIQTRISSIKLGARKASIQLVIGQPRVFSTKIKRK